MGGDFDTVKSIAGAFGGFNMIRSFAKNRKEAAYRAAQDAEPDNYTLNWDMLANIYGTLQSDAIRDIDTRLKIMVGGVVRGLAKRDHPTWHDIMEFLSQFSLLQPREGSEINNTNRLVISQSSWFKSTSQHKSNIHNVRGWLMELINDPDVVDARVDIDLAAVTEIVGHAGNIMEGLSLRFKKQNDEIKVLDIGFIRYPDRTHPYIKVYRIELFAWYSSKTIGGHSNDENGIWGRFNSRAYVPRPEVIDALRESTKAAAVREAEELFA
ncbi:hypothetical protein AURDEDRAFT_164340 [Auricularia subglabra TFB-10046 SS5]|nr:hypothetical protein AURDEDRAFT_164340 [Auricularia subglabra TFB-10046 SS5]